ncbi:MAG: hypothetical protein ACLUGJ_09655 [Blautia wexlerae]
MKTKAEPTATPTPSVTPKPTETLKPTVDTKTYRSTPKPTEHAKSHTNTISYREPARKTDSCTDESTVRHLTMVEITRNDFRKRRQQLRRFGYILLDTEADIRVVPWQEVLKQEMSDRLK